MLGSFSRRSSFAKGVSRHWPPFACAPLNEELVANFLIGYLHLGFVFYTNILQLVIDFNHTVLQKTFLNLW